MRIGRKFLTPLLQYIQQNLENISGELFFKVMKKILCTGGINKKSGILFLLPPLRSKTKLRYKELAVLPLKFRHLI